MEKYKFTVLCDNTAHAPFKAEHGFSALIELGRKRLLFDCGSTDVYKQNAALIGRDLTAVDAVVLSHNHYDHAGGFPLLCESQCRFELYMSSDFYKNRFWIDSETGETHWTSSEVTREFIDKRLIRPHYVAQPLTPVPSLPGAYILSGFSRLPFEPRDETNFVKCLGGSVVDDYADELALAVMGEDGLTVITGCAHSGAASICAAASARLDRPVARFFGGTHLVAFDSERAQATAEYFERSAVKTLGACHCTGDIGREALCRLRSYRAIYAGFTVEWQVTNGFRY